MGTVLALEDLRLVGDDTTVPVVGGGRRRQVNLDYAASTPALVRVREAVDEFLPWYSSVARGSGFTSQVATAALEGAREAVGAFAGCRDDHVVIFVRNTTDAVNLLAAIQPDRIKVLSSPIEHHANMLPWRDHELELLPFVESRDDLLEACESALTRADGAIDLLAITGASNVTGEIWPVAELAAIAHDHGAQIFVDVAQLGPHRAIDVAELDLDYVALSGHKLYAPYGAGALIGKADRLSRGRPWLKGGGATTFVTLNDVVWAAPPARYEAGSPNVVGAVALGVACDLLQRVGMGEIAEHERALGEQLRRGLSGIDGVRMLRLWPEGACDRLGVVAFVVDGLADGLVAAVLSAEHAIGVRHGRFCAHPLLARLLDLSESEAEALRARVETGAREGLRGALRASLGIGTRPEDVEALVAAIRELLEVGPSWSYRQTDAPNHYAPDPDPREFPDLSCRLVRQDR
ncbi:MAG TPA: aminotransferase class V-fold PLP-dependent enzyme [Gaiellaceae bacterium]|nr:aminotransferase class V-fold PLP-dependent enzyme [Gaiellaceae bacterium]